MAVTGTTLKATSGCASDSIIHHQLTTRPRRIIPCLLLLEFGGNDSLLTLERWWLVFIITFTFPMSYPVLPTLEEEKAGWTPAYVGGQQMDSHRCMWEGDHVECPERISVTIRHCEEMGLLARMKHLPFQPCTPEEVALFHEREYVNQIASTAKMDEKQLQRVCRKYDSIYICPKSYDCALLATGAVVEAAKAVVNGKCAGAIALVRPPGHHAMIKEANGFCIFNNVGVAAAYALEHLGVKRVLIVDWDVHYGQGVQQAFYERSDVLCISIHRHEQGTFWPFMREGEHDRIGCSAGTGFNVNIPLNQEDLGDADYLAIFWHIILPIATEYKPDLVFVSAGFDAAVGCPVGHMMLSPQIYGHLTNMLISVAGNRLVVALEGGYCIDSLKWSVSCVMQALLRDPLIDIAKVNVPVNPAVVKIMHLVAMKLQNHWECMRAFMCTLNRTSRKTGSDVHRLSTPVFLGWRHHVPPKEDIGAGSVSNPRRLWSIIRSLERLDPKSAASPTPRVHVHIINEGSTRTLRSTTFEELPMSNHLRSRICYTLSETAYNQGMSIPANRTRQQMYVKLLHTAAQMVNSIMKRDVQSGVIAGDIPYFCIRNTIGALVSTMREHKVKRPLILCTTGNEMSIKLKNCNQVCSLYINTGLITDHDERKSELQLENASKKDGLICGSELSVKVGLPYSILRSAERYFVLQQLLLPLAYAHRPDFIVLELDFHSSFLLNMEPAFYCFMISNLMALASGRLLVFASAWEAFNQVNEYLLSILLPLAGSSPPYVEGAVSSSVDMDCISMVSTAIAQLQEHFPMLSSVFVPVGEPTSTEQLTGVTKKTNRGHSANSAAATEGSRCVN
uniref:Hist_deacetyl domain-containing protein n=1 Tax=Trichuris muris TaxID=70415 RepID=A0A5S6Q3G7_TRIMR